MHEEQESNPAKFWTNSWSISQDGFGLVCFTVIANGTRDTTWTTLRSLCLPPYRLGVFSAALPCPAPQPPPTLILLLHLQTCTENVPPPGIPYCLFFTLLPNFTNDLVNSEPPLLCHPLLCCPLNPGFYLLFWLLSLWCESLAGQQILLNHKVSWHFLSLSITCFGEAIPEIHLSRPALEIAIWLPLRPSSIHISIQEILTENPCWDILCDLRIPDH